MRTVDTLIYQRESGAINAAEYKRELESQKAIRIGLGDTQAIRFINELLRALQ